MPHARSMRPSPQRILIYLTGLLIAAALMRCDRVSSTSFGATSASAHASTPAFVK